MHAPPQLQLELTAASETFWAGSDEMILPSCSSRESGIDKSSTEPSRIVEQQSMSVPHGSWRISDTTASGQARVHIGHHNEYHDHRYYGHESQLSLAERQRAREDAILSSLYFTDMSARERAIDSSYNDTFGWIFDEQVTERQSYYERNICISMSRWLEHEYGMFFIVGKAGSGKSTLMRFLARHKRTNALLQNWAGQYGCTLAVSAH